MLTACLVPGQLLLGLAALALAMDRHHDQLARRWRGRLARAMLRGFGATCMASALLCAVSARGGAQGVLLWLGWATPSALAVIGLLACGPGRKRQRGAD